MDYIFYPFQTAAGIANDYYEMYGSKKYEKPKTISPNPEKLESWLREESIHGLKRADQDALEVITVDSRHLINFVEEHKKSVSNARDIVWQSRDLLKTITDISHPPKKYYVSGLRGFNVIKRIRAFMNEVGEDAYPGRKKMLETIVEQKITEYRNSTKKLTKRDELRSIAKSKGVKYTNSLSMESLAKKVKEPELDDLEKMKIDKLKELAKSKGVKNINKKKKRELIASIREITDVSDDFSKMSIRELYDLAKTKNIKNMKSLKKSELIEKLKEL